MRALVVLVLALLPTARDGGDDQYHFLSGLADKGLHEQVIKEAGRFLSDYPRHEKRDLVRYRLAAALFDCRRQADAVPLFRELAGREGFEFRAESAFRLGQCLLEAGDCQGASSALETAVRVDKEYLRAGARFLYAEALLACQRVVEAEREYAALLAAEPRGPQAGDIEVALVWCAFKRRDFAAAARRAEPLAARPPFPRQGEVFFLLGECAIELGQAQVALKAYLRVESGAYHEAALRGAGFAAAELGDHPQAARHFEAVIERYPASRFRAECALHAGIERLAAGDAKGAAERLRSKVAGEGAELDYWRARAAAAAGERELALETLGRAQSQRPEKELAQRISQLRGELLLALGRGEEAQRELLRSGDDWSLAAAASSSLAAERFGEARQSAERLLESFPDSAYRQDAWLVLGEAWFAQERWNEAERAFSEGARGADAEKSLRARSRSAWCQYRRGDHAAAAQGFEALLDGPREAVLVEEAAFMVARSQEQAGDKAAAARSFARFASVWPKSKRRPQALLAGARLSEGGAGSRALEEIARTGGDPALVGEAHFELAERASREGRCAEAEPHYRALLASGQPAELVPQARYGLAWCLDQRGASGEALELLRPWMAEKGGEAKLRAAALELLVHVEAKGDDSAAAVRALLALHASNQDPERLGQAARAVARALRRVEEPERLLAELAALDASLGRTSVARLFALERVHALVAAERVDEAESELTRLARGAADDPELAEAAFFVAEARWGAGQTARALELYERSAAVAANPLCDRALYKTGFVALKAGELERAERSLAALVRDHPQSELCTEGLFLLGETRFRAGAFESAIAALERVRKEAPRHAVLPKALFRLGLAQLELARWKEGQAALTELLRKYPSFENAVEAELGRGRALAALGESREARAAFERVIEKDRGVLSARAHLELGGLHETLGDRESALSEYLKVAVLYACDEECAEALVRAGALLDAQGQRERAEEQWREALAKYPKTRGARSAQAKLGQVPTETPVKRPAPRDV